MRSVVFVFLKVESRGRAQPLPRGRVGDGASPISFEKII